MKPVSRGKGKLVRGGAKQNWFKEGATLVLGGGAKLVKGGGGGGGGELVKVGQNWLKGE